MCQYTAQHKTQIGLTVHILSYSWDAPQHAKRWSPDGFTPWTTSGKCHPNQDQPRPRRDNFKFNNVYSAYGWYDHHSQPKTRCQQYAMRFVRHPIQQHASPWNWSAFISSSNVGLGRKEDGGGEVFRKCTWVGQYTHYSQFRPVMV